MPGNLAVIGRPFAVALEMSLKGLKIKINHLDIFHIHCQFKPRVEEPGKHRHNLHTSCFMSKNNSFSLSQHGLLINPHPLELRFLEGLSISTYGVQFLCGAFNTRNSWTKQTLAEHRLHVDKSAAIRRHLRYYNVFSLKEGTATQTSKVSSWPCAIALIVPLQNGDLREPGMEPERTSARCSYCHPHQPYASWSTDTSVTWVRSTMGHPLSGI